MSSVRTRTERERERKGENRALSPDPNGKTENKISF